MKIHAFTVIVSLLAFAGCDSRRERVESRPDFSVGVFNHDVLFTHAEGLPKVLGKESSDWNPSDIAIDEYGALVRYDKIGSFADLRNAIDHQFAEHTVDGFENDLEMGLWRIEDPGFAIQLTEDEDFFTIAYVRFIDELTMADKFEEFATENPDLVDGVDGFNWQCFVAALRETGDSSTEQSDAPESASRGVSTMEDQPRGPGDR